MLNHLVERLPVAPRKIHKNIIVLKGVKSPWIGIVKDVRAKLGELAVIIVVDGYLFDVIVEDTTMEKLKGVIDLVNHQVRLGKDEHTVIIPLEQIIWGKNTEPGTDGEECIFTSFAAYSSSENKGSTVDENEQELVIVMQSDLGEGKSAEAEFMIVLGEILSHLKEDDKLKIQELLLGSNIIARSIDEFDNLRPKNGTVKISLCSNAGIVCTSRDIGSPKKNNIVRQEIGKMLDAEIIAPVSS